MAYSKCANCGSTHFEAVHAQNLEGTTRAIIFIQCADCGAVISALDLVNVGLQFNQVKEDWQRLIERLTNKLGSRSAHLRR